MITPISISAVSRILPCPILIACFIIFLCQLTVDARSEFISESRFRALRLRFCLYVFLNLGLFRVHFNSCLYLFFGLGSVTRSSRRGLTSFLFCLRFQLNSLLGSGLRRALSLCSRLRLSLGPHPRPVIQLWLALTLHPRFPLVPLPRPRPEARLLSYVRYLSLQDGRLATFQSSRTAEIHPGDHPNQENRLFEDGSQSYSVLRARSVETPIPSPIPRSL